MEVFGFFFKHQKKENKTIGMNLTLRRTTRFRL